MTEQKEIWKGIPGYESLYEISNTGKVKSLSIKKAYGRYCQIRPEIILRPSIKKRGYHQVALNNVHGERKHFGIHQLVALVFIPNPENKPTVNHKNGDKSNNHYLNLEWATNKEQINHADSTGLRNISGSRSKRSKLTETQVLKIRELYGSKPLKELAMDFNIYHGNIRKIIKRQMWKHI